MDYKPGLISASIFHGKKDSQNVALKNLFSKKAGPIVSVKTEIAAGKKGLPKSPKKADNEVGNPSKEILNTTVGKNGKADGKRKHEEGITTPTSSKKVKMNSEDKKAGGERNLEDTMSTHTKLKKVKRESSASGQRQSAENPDSFPYVHESLLKKSPQQTRKKQKKKEDDEDDADDDERQAMPRTRRKRNKTADKRTIFVGNCPLSADKKVMKSIFKDHGAIETIRFRCGPTATLELPKKAVMIRKEFHEKASSYVCFIVFKNEEMAEKALMKNGYELDGHHLRVDLASNQNQHDKRRSVFVGNLPFNVTEEDLRSHFEDCGDILNVRVVRDRKTSIGKGIAYIQFDSRDGVVLALKLNDVEFHERKLRVMRCSGKAKQKTEDNPQMTNFNPRMGKKKALSKTTFEGKAKDYYSRSNPRPEKHRIKFAPTNKTTSKKSFHDVFEAKKEKRVNNLKKKKQRSQKSDGLSSIFGDISADAKQLKMDNPKFMDKSKKPKDKKKEKMKAKKKLKKASSD